MGQTNLKRITVLTVILVVAGIISSALLAAFLIIRDPYYKSSQLIKAIEKKDYDKLEKMLSDGTDPNIPEFRETFYTRMCETAPVTPLGFAAVNDDLEAVNILLMHDADPNYIKNSKSWPLGDAIFTNGSNSLEIVKKLLEYGSEPYESNGYKNAFYTVAGKYCVESDTRQQLRLVEIMEYLLNNSGETPHTVFYKSNEVLSLAIYAVFTGRNPILIRFLLENGDSVDSDSTYYGISLYDWCHYDENKTILAILEEYGYFQQKTG